MRKKQRVGAYFAFNPDTLNLEPRDGFSVEAKWLLEGEFKRMGRNIIGRTLDIEDGITVLHDYGNKPKHVSADSLHLSMADLDFLGRVLAWQMPRIFAFEQEINDQKWIPQGLTNTHQFVIVPPQHLDTPQINTQYFDFHPHWSLEEMDRLTKGVKFSSLPTDEKITKFY